MTETFHLLAPDDALVDGQSRGFVVNGWPVLLCRTEGQYFAILNRCSHADAKLEGGRIRRGAISCPLHGTPFNLRSGECQAPVRYRTLKIFPVQVKDGSIEVAIPDTAPDPLQTAL